MYKLIFNILTDPLGLPVPLYWEWIILFFIGEISYRVAYIKVGFLYRYDFISGRQQGSLLHWGIRLICYLVIWGITRAIIIIFRFIMSHIFILTGMLIMAIIATVTTIIVMHNRHKK